MTGASIRIGWERMGEVMAATGDLVAAAEDMSVLMDAIGGMVVESTTRRFDEERGPDGNPWPPSLRATLEGGQTLTDRGRLRQSITYQAGPEHVDAGTNVIYAAIHQFGGVIRPKGDGKLKFQLPGGGFATVDKVTMPARPYLGIDTEDEAEILALATDYFSGAGGAAVAS